MLHSSLRLSEGMRRDCAVIARGRVLHLCASAHIHHNLTKLTLHRPNDRRPRECPYGSRQGRHQQEQQPHAWGRHRLIFSAPLADWMTKWGKKSATSYFCPFKGGQLKKPPTLAWVTLPQKLFSASGGPASGMLAFCGHLSDMPFSLSH